FRVDADTAWNGIREEAGLKWFKFEWLRDSYVSWLALGNLHPKVAQELVGHSDIKVTMEIYTEIQREQHRQAVNTLPTFRASGTFDLPGEKEK
ncbi:MAG: tyrosine-type recombinase/integrase, partial [Deltaproteobacteria bacterium]|nr:tyrosine-type recombinase/integrase [Deltaproteobacteria bacterium]